jgi:hypothetical protein
VAEYIEKFDSIVHQILAHDPKFSIATITNRFIDGLKEDIRNVVLVHRPTNLDTASSIALLQEEYYRDPPKKEFRKHESNTAFKYSGRNSSGSFGGNAASQATKGAEHGQTSSKRNSDSTRGNQSEDKAATLMNYRRAKGLCYKCGLKWSPGHKCATSVPLHVVEEL